MIGPRFYLASSITRLGIVCLLPNLSQTMIAKKTENPRPDKRISHNPRCKIIVQKNEPINSAEPQGRACGLAVLGHKE